VTTQFIYRDYIQQKFQLDCLKVCHGFKLTEQDDVFESLLTTFEADVFLKAAGAAVQIGSNLKSNHN